MDENGEICHFLGRTRKWYRYQKLVSVPIVQRRNGTGTHCQKSSSTDTGPSGTGTDASNNTVFVSLALLSLVFVHRLFRDPNKRLMGVQIRMKVSEKRTVPYRLGEAIFV